MKMSDVLHSIADMLDQKEGGSNAPLNTEKSADKFQHDVDDGAEQAGSDSEVGKFIPPLQAKHEILKKSAGLDNEFDQQNDELDDIKKIAGIKPVIMQITNDDGPFDS